MDVLTYHNDLRSDGQNTSETILTPASVKAGFGKQYTTGLDGWVYAQPLVKTGVAIQNQGVHDVVYVATEHDSVYALDAGSGAILWQVNFTNPSQGVTTIPWHDALSFSLEPEIGITGTPVIDPGTNTLYVVAATQEPVGGVNHYLQRLYALDLGSGAIKSMNLIADTSATYTDSGDVSTFNFTYNSGPAVAGTGDGSTGGQVHFNALRELQRGALVLSGGTVYVVWASFNDRKPYHGWVLGFDAASLQLKALACLTPNGSAGGVWESGGGLSVDDQGDLFLVTGNGTFDPSQGNYGDSVVKLVADPTTTPANPGINGWGLKVADYFASARLIQSEAANFLDDDLGSTGVLLLPDSVGKLDAQGKRQQLLLIGSKEGHLYLLDRNNLGHLTDQVVQEVTVPFTMPTQGIFGTPAYYNGQIYVLGSQTPGFTYAVSNSVLTLSSQSTDAFGGVFIGTTSISSDGATNGIAWNLVNIDPNGAPHYKLRAYGADGYANAPLYTTEQASGGRDRPEPGNFINTGNIVYLTKFTEPTIANGRVYVVTNDSLVAYGLLPKAPGISSSTETNFTANFPNAFTVTATGSPAPTLSWTGDLPAGLTFKDNGDGTATLGGTPAVDAIGPHLLNITAHNGVGADATQRLTLTVGAAAAITSTDHATFTTGTASSFTVKASGSPPPYFYAVNPLPAGVTFLDNHDGTATLGGTPAPQSVGTYGLDITAVNRELTSQFQPNGTFFTQHFTLTVNQAPAITSAAGAVFPVGAAGSFKVTATGSPAPTLAEVGALPGGVTFDPATGTLAGTPDPGTARDYPLTFTAHNGVGADARQDFTLTVGKAPAIDSASSTSFAVGQAGSFRVTATGTPAPTLAEAGTLPAGVTFDPATGLLGGTPAAGTARAYNLSFSATNGVGSPATQPFTLTVNQATAITSTASVTFVVGQSGTFRVTAAGTPNPAIGATGMLPGGVTFVDNGDGTATLGGTPAPGTAGNYPLKLNAHNGVGADGVQDFMLIVNPPPSILFTNPSKVTFTVGSPGAFKVTAAGTPTPSLGEVGSLPGGVTLVDNGDGTATLGGTPAAGTGRTYNLSFSAHNGVAADSTQAFELTVDEAPTFQSGSSTTFTAGTVGTFRVATSGFPDRTYSEQGPLPGGVALDPATGVLGGTPAAGTGRVYHLTIAAGNGIGTDATQPFTLTVNEAAAITSGDSTTFNAGVAASFPVIASGFPAPTFTVRSGTLPGGVALDPGTGVLGGTPAAGTGGVYHLTIAAGNGVRADAVQPFTLTVDEAPAIASDTATFLVGIANSFAVAASGFPRPTFSATGTLPSGVTLDPATGVLGGTPAAITGGIYPLTITASNGAGTDASHAFRLVVNQAPTITSGNSVAFTVGGTDSYSVTTLGFPKPTISVSPKPPDGVTLDATTGILSGTPAPHTGGIYHLTLIAANGVGSDVSRDFTLAINEAPAINSGGSATFAAGVAGGFPAATASGFPKPTFSEKGGMPGGLTLDPATGMLGGTPAAGTGGVYHLTLIAGNGVGGDATLPFTLTVDEAPAINGGGATFTEGLAGRMTVTASGYPLPTLTVDALPSGVTFVDNHDGTATLGGIPSAGTAGTYTLYLTASNTQGTRSRQPFMLMINPASPVSITSGDGATFTVGARGTTLVTTTGVPIPTVARGGELPRGVTFVDNGDGTATLAGTPAPDTGGTYNLTLIAHNGVNADAARGFTLIVNQPAAITSDNGTTFTVGSAGTFKVQASAAAFPKPTFTVSGDLPPGVTFVDNGDGTATFGGTPAPGTGGRAVPLTLNAHNGVGADATQKFTLTIVQPSFRPVIDSIGPVASPRSTPISTVSVTLSEAIDPSTFTASALLLTRDGAPVSLANSPVTVSPEAGSASRYNITGLDGLTSTPGSYVLMIGGSGLRDLYGTSGTGSRSVEFLVTAPPPQVTVVQQAGRFFRKASLLISFNEPLDPGRAADLANYTLIPVHPGRHMPPLPRAIAANYSSSSQTVGLTLSRAIKPGQLYQLQISGNLLNGLTSQSGTLLDGAGNGKAGTNFSILVTNPSSRQPATGRHPRSAGGVSGHGRSHGGHP